MRALGADRHVAREVVVKLSSRKGEANNTARIDRASNQVREYLHRAIQLLHN